MRVNKCKPCGESSPYWNWVTDHEAGDSDYIATPDVKAVDPLLQSILDVLDEGGEQVLTPRQRKAFQLVVREGLSYRQAAKAMRVGVNAVYELVQAGARKLRILALTK
jgi:DNA-directed RNA polymerase specialized sigma24 family protein